jgi:hypothetical protein
MLLLCIDFVQLSSGLFEFGLLPQDTILLPWAFDGCIQLLQRGAVSSGIDSLIADKSLFSTP